MSDETFPTMHEPSYFDIDTGPVTKRRFVPAPPEPCPNCDDTGDVHRLDGEWLGACDCPAGENTPTEDSKDHE